MYVGRGWWCLAPPLAVRPRIERDGGGGGMEDDLSVPVLGGWDMKRTCSCRRGPSLHLRRHHYASLILPPVISQRGVMPYGCKELLSEKKRRFFVLAESQGGRDGPEFSQLSQFRLCDVPSSLHGVALTNPSCACSISRIPINKQELPPVSILLLHRKRRKNEAGEEEHWRAQWGWDESSMKHLLDTRIALVMKSI